MALRGVIFDLDGVITQSGEAHARSWETLFNRYLKSREERFGETFRPFDLAKDYLQYVDGRPRYDGVKSFLASRNIELPFGDPTDPPGKETVCGLGNEKNQIFHDYVEAHGVEVFSGSLEWIHQLLSQGILIGMATSSKNGPLIIDKAGIAHLFQAKVDGNVSAELGLAGKPKPDIFLEAARRLGLKPEECAVVEDALSGVAAGRAGHFALVIGVARSNTPEELIANGAHVAVKDLREWVGKTLEEIK